jgi:UDP-glucose:(heptosyl)LPS alpha-1,3-glucosyltransferase
VINLRIGIAIQTFDPKKGGAERYSYDLSLKLVKLGHSVVVFCRRGVSLPGVTLAQVNTASYPRWLRSLSFALNQRKISKAQKLDVMLGFGNVFEADVYQSHGGVQHIWMRREIESYRDPVERRFKAMLLKSSLNQKIQQWIAEYPIRNRKYKRIVAISGMIRDHMGKHFGLKPDDFQVVYNGVDTMRFRPLDDAGGLANGATRRILFSAGNFRLKGLFPLLQALGELAKERRDFHLTVLGRGRKERYLSLIGELDVGDLVTFLGETAHPERIYAQSHILAHPTYYDACSLTTMEAMAAGLPTITTRWNGASALVSLKEGYVLNEPADVAGLTSALRDLCDDDRRREMGRNARAKLETYTIERNAKEMEKILVEAGNG